MTSLRTASCLLLLPVVACLPPLPELSEDSAVAGLHLSRVDIEPSEPRTNDVVQAVVEPEMQEDLDYSLSFIWDISGEISDVDTRELAGESYFEKGDTLVLTVIPTLDGVQGDSLSSEAITVQNTPPTTPEIILDVNSMCGSLVLSEETQTVATPNKSSLEFEDEMSVEIWINLPDSGDTSFLFGQGNESGFVYRLDFLDNQQLQLTLPIDGSQFVSEDDPALQVGGWKRIVLSYKNNRWRVFVNGALVLNERAPVDLSSTDGVPFHVGVDPTGYHATTVSQIHALQISRNVPDTEDYSESFSPDPMRPDEYTAALWHFGSAGLEGQYSDLSSNEHTLYTVDASWLDECPYAYRDLVCEVIQAAVDEDAVDMDSIVHTFGWSIDGEEYTDAIRSDGLAQTIYFEDISPGSEYTCAVRAKDSEEYGDPMIESYTIGGEG